MSEPYLETVRGKEFVVYNHERKKVYVARQTTPSPKLMKAQSILKEVLDKSPLSK